MLHRKQTGRPKINEKKLLAEEQLKQFAQNPWIFKSLKFENPEATQMVQALVQGDQLQKKFQDLTSEPSSQEKIEDEEGEIETIIRRILVEREFEAEGPQGEEAEELQDEEPEKAQGGEAEKEQNEREQKRLILY